MGGGRVKYDRYAASSDPCAGSSARVGLPSDREILAGLLHRDYPAVDGLLARHGDIAGVLGASRGEVEEHVGRAAAEVVEALSRVAPALARCREVAGGYVRSSRDVYRVLQDMAAEPTERMVVLVLNGRNQVIYRVVAAAGGANSASVSPREIFADAVRLHAAAVVVAHNHPSGDPSPSDQDVEVTRRLVECGRLLGIPLLDHVVVAASGYVSLSDSGSI